eukprot:TRINITY_DN9202_c0_g1_i1.p2 TRINITY_DN9202_c0_g1~~TRINITY_DN9202_c0_g1_i1.p2  ORF type:complete len:109 (+),score=1.10 TRINITY_DN9202_c0_g1_i1:99-425(+)
MEATPPFLCQWANWCTLKISLTSCFRWAFIACSSLSFQVIKAPPYIGPLVRGTRLASFTCFLSLWEIPHTSTVVNCNTMGLVEGAVGSSVGADTVVNMGAAPTHPCGA